MRIFKPIRWILLLASIGSSWARLPESPAEYAEWEKSSLRRIDELAALPSAEAIPLLGDAIYKQSLPNNIESGDRPVFSKAQSQLRAIPGHASYYRDRIEFLRSEVLRNNGRMPTSDDAASGKMPATLGDYEDARSNGFAVLALLPSPESVEVLGGFLNDPEGLDGQTLLGRPWRQSDSMPYPPNARAAAISLRKLGIQMPPFRASPISLENEWIAEGEVDAWKDWWNEVKAGQRTYRLAGSPVEYGPDGPVSKNKLAEIQRGEKRNEDRLAGKRKSHNAAASPGDSGDKPYPFAMVPGGVVVAVAAGCFLCRKRLGA